MNNAKNPKEIFCEKIINIVKEFENKTGVEVHSIYFPGRLDDSEIADKYIKTIISKIAFELK